MSYTIRPSTLNDLPELVAMSVQFSNELEVDELNIKYTEQDAYDSIKMIINQRIAVALSVVDEIEKKIVGSIAGIINPWLLDKRALTLQELWFYILKEHRNSRLAKAALKAFEAYGKHGGATHCIMATHLNSRRALERFYKMSGYRHLEHHYIREL